MTKKLIRTILTSWLLFSSLYLPAHAETTTATRENATKSALKKSPEAQFLDGKTCLDQNNINCAKLALALIPSISPYAKILDGALALQNKQPDQALLLLLPLQADESLIIAARTMLQRTLAKAFADIGDVQQAVQHFISVERLFKQDQARDSTNEISVNHAQIWQLLRTVEQADLVALRGNNTDSVFQGWVDLSLAAQHADSKSRISDWRTIYADHPAQTFTQTLIENIPTASKSTAALNPDSVITVMLPTQTMDSAKVSAFMLGLQKAANLAQINNPIQTYHAEQIQPEEIARTDYFVIPEFAETAESVPEDLMAGKPTLHIQMPLQDEANAILKFAIQHSMQHLTIVTTQHEAAQSMLSSIRQAWSSDMEQSGYSEPRVITLDADVLAQPLKLLDLKSQIASELHDIVILAMPAQDIVKIRPYLDISTPTITFSAIHDIAFENDTLKLLNALRFVDMPFLVESKPEHDDYRYAAAELKQKDLLRWFAMGADSLQLISLIKQTNNRPVLLKGLAGDYELSGAGQLTRNLSAARFNQHGVSVE